MELSGLSVYPVKGCRGTSVEAAEVDELGIVGDRRFMIVDQNGVFVTQRSLPALARIEPRLSSTGLRLLHGSNESGDVPLIEPSAPVRRTQVWSSGELLVDDCGDRIAAWLSSAVDHAVRLVRIGRDFERKVRKPAAAASDRVNFADACPFLVISEASLEDLNQRLLGRGEPAVPMNRFRPNLVIRGASPYAEDGWTRLTIGKMSFRAAGLCARCIVTTTDQLTGERGKEPLRTLATYRRDPAKPTDINFGQNLIHETKSGQLRLGDPVTLIPQAAPR